MSEKELKYLEVVTGRSSNGMKLDEIGNTFPHCLRTQQKENEEAVFTTKKN